MTQNSNKPVTTDYFLKPGYIYLPEQPTLISTVLGSSVAVALYDRSLKRGGMNHYLFPRVEQGRQTTAQYGNVAVLTLIRMMINAGSKISHLRAQIFGGAFNHELSTRNIGAVGIKTARRILAAKKIPIASEDTGGELGRKIVFNTATCETIILKVDQLREGDWFPYSQDR